MTRQVCTAGGDRLAAGVVLAMLVALVALGCERQSRQRDYEVVDGVVEAIRPDTLELTVRPSERWSGRGRTATITCLLTGDGEIYVNDRFSSFEAIAVGDAIEVIGYPERGGPRGERLVVSYAYIRRSEPPVAVPELSLPAAPPTTTQPQEN